MDEQLMREDIGKSSWEDKVFKIFSDVADKYDVMNDLMSLGLHRFWKQKFASKIVLHDGISILDSATGSGDIGLLLTKRARSLGIRANITMADVNEKMLQRAIDRSIDGNCFHNLTFSKQDAQCLSFENGVFDYYVIAFGIRNVCNVEIALQEALRVLKPNGVFLCLEFAECQAHSLHKLYHGYKRHIIPKIGECVAKNRYAYQYLVDSIDQFYNQQEFSQFLKEVGFVDVTHENFARGVCAVYHGRKREI